MIRNVFSAGKAAGKDEGKKPTDSMTEAGRGGVILSHDLQTCFCWGGDRGWQGRGERTDRGGAGFV